MTTETLLSAVLAEAVAELAAAGIEQAEADAQLILAHVLGESRGRVMALALMGAPIQGVDRDRVAQLVAERARRVPLQHLTGRAAFRSIELEVGPGVFVPRPETEIVAQLAIDALQLVPKAEPVAVDLCAGSGTIALAIAQEVPNARVWAVERSPEAHAWAERNVARLGDGRVTLRLGDVAELPDDDPLLGLSGAVDVLVSNPPYVPSGMVPRDAEVREHDPEEALYSGPDGLDLIRSISRLGLRLVAPGGVIALEHAEGQGSAIRSLLVADGWSSPATHRDLTQRDRATTAVR